LSEQLIYTAEKSIKDAGDKITADVKTAVEGKVTALKAVKDGQDLAAIKKAMDELSSEMQKIGEAMNKAQQEAQAQTPPAGATGADAGAQNSGTNPGEGGAEGNVRDAETK